MEELTKEDLKERLIVAEKVMKSLFLRNKELEEKFQTDQKTTASTFEGKPDTSAPSPPDQGQDLAKENTQLKARIATLEEQISELNQTQSTKIDDADKPLKELMELRLQETMAEAKRHYQSYVDIRE